MEQATYASRLRYLDADDIDDSVVSFDGLDVVGRDDEKLGDIDGFIVDADSGRVHYAVVDAGGWFSSRRMLLPIGHAAVDRERGVLRVDLTKKALRQYPEFDENRFREFSNEDLRAFERRIAAACCPDELWNDVAVGAAYYESRRHYAQPEWWQGRAWSRERLGPIDTSVYRIRGGAAAGRAAADSRAAARAAARTTPETSRAPVDRERVTARGPEDSPHFDGRAQPGDVLGLETGGERTGLGDTTEDENRRREAAERARRDD
jgi:hypothetical protein